MKDSSLRELDDHPSSYYPSSARDLKPIQRVICGTKTIATDRGNRIQPSNTVSFRAGNREHGAAQSSNCVTQP